ncbi:MAG: hypothetical protein A3I66_00160 [Burkholderiales bacterium RIFCSPLOWO2_02_FULL_57_36]|nr:MAG: hypothetical protein A3I66_00160 [Burkholderiales bacterium RIFCSPLOWO2_02_FULL_57_36]
MNQHMETGTIDTILRAFEQGDIATLVNHIDDNIDFRIDHYQDATDVNWQKAANKTELLALLQRLGTEVFPKGTKMIEVSSTHLGGHWVITKLHQQFYYGVQAQMVDSETWIVSHSKAGKCDYFRETVTNVLPLAAAV